jgi:hypothetical protein
MSMLHELGIKSANEGKSYDVSRLLSLPNELYMTRQVSIFQIPLLQAWH